MSSLSLRLRLTLWYSAVVAAVVLVGIGLTLFFMRTWLLRPIDREIAFQVNVFAKAVAAAGSEEELRDLSGAYLSSPESEELRNLGFVLLVWTRSDAVVSNSSVPFEQSAAGRRVFQGAPGFTAPQGIESPTGDPYRAAIVPITQGSTRLGVVVVAASLAQLTEHLQQFALIFAALGLLAVAGSTAGTWALLGRAFRPVESITETAAQFSREDPSRRIAYRGPSDEIGHLVATLNSMLDRVERSFREQQQFLYDASHELRTPLSIVKGHLEVLDSIGDVTTEMRRDAHQVVMEEIDRMNRLVSGLLTLAKSGEQGFLVMETLRLDEFLEQLFAHAVHLGEREWSLEPVPPLTVWADADRLTQVLLNLLKNAVEHTAPGERIALGGSKEESWARIWVRDEGEGMLPEERERIFDRFYSNKTRGDGGYGLGLSIVQALVQAHGGHVEVQSSPEHGSTFAILLPLSEEDPLSRRNERPGHA
ncbi:MAG: HAMP domain-containing histidine kinase [Thermoleophilia bacterium]|nr:HAMP domain-containing histidine kinase [Thermoleophilia bacterium]